jgi:hypothetical protein
LGFNYKVEYKQGKHNKVVDALSRTTHSSELMAISTVIPSWITQVLQSYENDTKCSGMITKLSVNTEALPNVTLVKGLLRYKGRLLIGSSGNLRTQLLQSFHNSALGGHLGERATYQRLKLHFYWHQMKKQVTEYVKICPTCQKNKAEHVPYQDYSNLYPFLNRLGLTFPWTLWKGCQNPTIRMSS